MAFYIPMLDSGQGHTQLTLQPHVEGDLLPAEEDSAPKRRRRADGIAGPNKAALGVNSLIILASSPVKSENWINLDYFMETDWKMIIIVETWPL